MRRMGCLRRVLLFMETPRASTCLRQAGARRDERACGKRDMVRRVFEFMRALPRRCGDGSFYRDKQLP